MSKVSIGTINSFDHENQDWAVFKARLEQWFLANDLETEEVKVKVKQRAILLSALSECTFKLVRDLALPNKVTALDYSTLVKLLDDHFEPAKCGFAERNHFYTSTQQPEEQLAAWAARVRGLAVDCAFPASCLNDLLRDRFVLGMLPGPERDKLFTMDMAELTLSKALETAQAIRSARLGAAVTSSALPEQSVFYKLVQSAGERVDRPGAGQRGQNGASRSGPVDTPQDGTPRTAVRATKCVVCGYAGHQPDTCRFKRYKCAKCGERGHLRRVCGQRKVQQHFVEVELDDVGDDVRSGGEGEPSVHILARSRVYNVGETKAIYCEGRNLENPIEWYSPSGKLIERSKDNRIYVEEKVENSVMVKMLIIHSISIEDGGNWTCKSGDLSETREFIVGEKVHLEKKFEEVEGEERKSVKLTCEAKGQPPPVVVWYKEKQPLNVKDDPKKYIVRGDHSLEIKNLMHTDTGLYTCKVRQKALSHYTEKNVQLSVLHKPIMLNSETQMIYPTEMYKTEEIYAILNETKNITCSTIAYPPAMFRWFRRLNSFDYPITDADSVIPSENGTSSTLVLRLYNSSNLGEYKCTANNTKGINSIVYHVSAGLKPSPPDMVSLYEANVTALIFNVSCSNCTYPEEDEVTPDPEAILGYSFQLVVAKKGYPPDWTDPQQFDVLVNDDALYTVEPLWNSTTFYARVCSRNAAGNSLWVEIPGEVATKSQAVKLAETILLLCLTILFVSLN